MFEMYEMIRDVLLFAGFTPLLLWFLVSVIVEVLSWLDDFEGTFFKDCNVFGHNLGFITGPDTEENKQFLAPMLGHLRSERVEDWMRCVAILMLLSMIVSVVALLWPGIIAFGIAIGMFLLIRHYIRARKQIKKTTHSVCAE